jgi:hypothetical protein
MMSVPPRTEVVGFGLTVKNSVPPGPVPEPPEEIETQFAPVTVL